MPSTIAIVSDLHLQNGSRRDAFRTRDGTSRGRHFKNFCQSLIDANLSTTLVLNGDIIDLWAIADTDELEGPDQIAAIYRNLRTGPGEDAAEHYIVRQLQSALGYHGDFASGLARFLERGHGQIVYLIGNHDHGMGNLEAQKVFRQHLLDLGAPQTEIENRVVFSDWFEHRPTRLWVEHGDQFAGKESRRPVANGWQEEAPGYYALRFIWNRYQHNHAIDKPRFGEMLQFLSGIAAGSPRRAEHREAMQYIIDYFMACDEEAVPAGKRLTAFLFDHLYDYWVGAGRPTRADDLYRRRRPRGVAPRTVGLLHAVRAGDTEDAVDPFPGEDLAPPEQFTRYRRGLNGRFRRSSGGFPRLSRRHHHVLALGHTHTPANHKLGVLVDRDAPQVYLNSGTWARPTHAPHFAYIKEGTMPLFGVRELRLMS